MGQYSGGTLPGLRTEGTMRTEGWARRTEGTMRTEGDIRREGGIRTEGWARRVAGSGSVYYSRQGTTR